MEHHLAGERTRGGGEGSGCAWGGGIRVHGEDRAQTGGEMGTGRGQRRVHGKGQCGYTRRGNESKGEGGESIHEEG